MKSKKKTNKLQKTYKLPTQNTKKTLKHLRKYAEKNNIKHAEQHRKHKRNT